MSLKRKAESELESADERPPVILRLFNKTRSQREETDDLRSNVPATTEQDSAMSSESFNALRDHLEQMIPRQERPATAEEEPVLSHDESDLLNNSGHSIESYIPAGHRLRRSSRTRRQISDTVARLQVESDEDEENFGFAYKDEGEDEDEEEESLDETGSSDEESSLDQESPANDDIGPDTVYNHTAPGTPSTMTSFDSVSDVDQHLTPAVEQLAVEPKLQSSPEKTVDTVTQVCGRELVQSLEPVATEQQVIEARSTTAEQPLIEEQSTTAEQPMTKEQLATTEQAPVTAPLVQPRVKVEFIDLTNPAPLREDLSRMITKLSKDNSMEVLDLPEADCYITRMKQAAKAGDRNGLAAAWGQLNAFLITVDLD